MKQAIIAALCSGMLVSNASLSFANDPASGTPVCEPVSATHPYVLILGHMGSHRAGLTSAEFGDKAACDKALALAKAAFPGSTFSSTDGFCAPKFSE